MKQNKKEYYENLKKRCLLLKNKQFQFGQNLISYIYPCLRNYSLEIEGEENIPVDSNVLFLVNHSNSHDIFTAYEVLSALQRKGSVMVATDCLNPITNELFNIANATLLDRRKKEERQNSTLELASKILNGKDGLIFGESTWNLHPTLPMHNIRTGATTISLISNTPVIPTIFEYIEKDGLLKTEGQLIKKCVIRFGKPIMFNYDDNIIQDSNYLKEEMIKLRLQIWKDYNIVKNRLDDIDPLVYLNHTYIKKFKAFGFTYNSSKEQEFLLFLDGDKKENEYTMDNDGNFVPGITEKNSILKKRLFK